MLDERAQERRFSRTRWAHNNDKRRWRSCQARTSVWKRYMRGTMTAIYCPLLLLVKTAELRHAECTWIALGAAATVCWRCNIWATSARCSQTATLRSTRRCCLFVSLRTRLPRAVRFLACTRRVLHRTRVRGEIVCAKMYSGSLLCGETCVRLADEPTTMGSNRKKLIQVSMSERRTSGCSEAEVSHIYIDIRQSIAIRGGKQR